MKEFCKNHKFIIFIVFCFLLIYLVLGIGRSQQISTIDRFNPFLKTETGYAVLPRESKINHSVNVYTLDNALKSGNWLKVTTGENKENNYIAVLHKGSFVSNIMSVKNKDSIPQLIQQQLGNKYYHYKASIEGPRSANHNIFWPFN